jgi:hypothetical protein
VGKRTLPNMTVSWNRMRRWKNEWHKRNRSSRDEMRRSAGAQLDVHAGGNMSTTGRARQVGWSTAGIVEFGCGPKAGSPIAAGKV